MNITQGIREAAQALGVDPQDLATIISYETGGTLDPLKRGPTTKWGQHRGLIQFGEPQAKQYGVDFSSKDNALASQLGADGAVVKYFKAHGAQPGMGLMDLYSIVNAGAPGRFNASDEKAGGAPGTVRDKVTNQMSGHRQRAASILGGENPQVQQTSQFAAAQPKASGFSSMIDIGTQPATMKTSTNPTGIPFGFSRAILDVASGEVSAEKEQLEQEKRRTALRAGTAFGLGALLVG